MTSFLTVVVLPTVGMFVAVFVLMRHLAHVRHLSKPYLGPILDVDPARLVTITGVVETAGPLIPSPVKDDPDVIAWSLHWRSLTGPNYGRFLKRFSPFTIVRSDGSRIHVDRLLNFDPRMSRMKIIHENDMSETAIQHLRRQQRAAMVQGEQRMSWMSRRRPDYIPRPADYDEPYDAHGHKRYGLTVLRPGDHITMPTELEVMRVDPDGTPRVTACPVYAYPLPYKEARSPFCAQGLVVIAMSAFMAAIVFFTIMPIWATDPALRQ